MGAFRLLLEVQSPDALRRFVHELLGPLLEYAQSRDTPLLETLEALSTSRWVRRAAARHLSIHINSMTYRVERIEALTGLQLDDPETRVAISIALRLGDAWDVARPGAKVDHSGTNGCIDRRRIAIRAH